MTPTLCRGGAHPGDNRYGEQGLGAGAWSVPLGLWGGGQNCPQPLSKEGSMYKVVGRGTDPERLGSECGSQTPGGILKEQKSLVRGWREELRAPLLPRVGPSSSLDPTPGCKEMGWREN